MQLDFDRSKISTGFYNGMVMPQCYEKAEEQLPKMKAMEIRDDDFLLCSFPKSGEREHSYIFRPCAEFLIIIFLSNKPGERKTPRFTIHSMDKITSTGS